MKMPPYRETGSQDFTIPSTSEPRMSKSRGGVWHEGSSKGTRLTTGPLASPYSHPVFMKWMVG